MKRRAVLAGGAVGAVVGGSPLWLRAQAVATVRMGTFTTDTYALGLYATDSGLFQKAGLNVEWTFVPAVVQALVAGAFDIGTADVVQAALPVTAGVDLGIFAGGAVYSTEAPTTLLAVAKASPIRTAKELEGQSIGVAQLASLSALAVREWLRQNGADVEKVKFVEIPFGTMSPALGRGQVAAAMIAEPFLTDARNDIRPLGKAYDAIAKSFYISTFMAKRDWLQKNGEVARRVVRVLNETAQWANTHHDETAPILAKYTKLELDRVRAMTRTSFAVPLDEHLMQPVLDIAFRYKQLSRAVSASELIGRV